MLYAKTKKIMKKCSNNSVFFTIWVSEFGASIFGRSNGPNISGFWIIRISGLQHWWNPMCCSAAVCVDAYGIFIAYIIYYIFLCIRPFWHNTSLWLLVTHTKNMGLPWMYNWIFGKIFLFKLSGMICAELELYFFRMNVYH